ncbi:MAG: cation transporter [Phycisphaerales bacterium]|nr:cation transporter [Phycisphaerales bacterium]
MSSTNTAPSNHTSFTLTIDDMTCGHCVQSVTNAVVGVQGVAVRSVAAGSATKSALCWVGMNQNAARGECCG